MADEVIGGVAVQITGDVSQLNAALGSSVSIAGTAGGKIAAAFNQGAAGADQLTTAAEGAAAAEGEFAGATEVANAALGHQVSQLQATSGAIRAALGEQSIRAAERFLTMIPGLGAALQYAFPVIGAIALGEAIGRVIGKSEELKAAEKELADATQRADDAFSHMQDTLDHLNVSHVTAAFGAASGKGAETTILEQQLKRIQTQADDARDSINQIAYAEANSLKNYIPFHSSQASVDKIKAAGQQIKELNDLAQEVQGRIDQGREDTKRAAAEEAGQLANAKVSAQVQANAHLSALNKAYSDEAIAQSHATVQMQIAGMVDRQAAAVATAQEELRVAQAKEQAVTSALASEVPKRIALLRAAGGAESAGQSRPQQQKIAIETQTKVGDYQAEADAQSIAAHKATTDAQAALDVAYVNQQREWADKVTSEWDKSYNARSKKARETFEAENFAAAQALLTQIRIAEIQDKNAGDVKALAIKGQEIALEQNYSQMVLKTGADRVSYLQQIAALEAKQTADKIAGLEASKLEAENLADSAVSMAKVAEIQGRINSTAAEGANQQTQAAGQITAAQNADNLGRQIGQSVANAITQTLPQSLGNALASGIFGGGKKGEDIGPQIAKALKQTGQQLLGQVFTELLSKMIEQIIVQTGLQAAFNALFPVTLTAQTAAYIGAQAAIAAASDTILVTAITASTTAIVTAIAAGAALDVFAGGTDFAPGGMALVGEKGPEIVNLPRGSQVVPNHAIKAYANGTSYQSTAFQTGTTNLHFHAHGMSNPDQFIDHVMRKLPEKLKARSSQFAALSH